MPGKYSHSVVLADYSSRGIISLPNDQHIAYLRSSPHATSQHSRHGSKSWSQSSPTSQKRSQSACAYPNRQIEGTRSASCVGRRVIVDGDLEASQNDFSRPQQPSFRSRSQQNFRITGKSMTNRKLEDTIHVQTTDTRNVVRPAALPQQNQNTVQQFKSNPMKDYDKVKISAEDFIRGTSSPSASLDAKRSPQKGSSTVELKSQTATNLNSILETRPGPDLLSDSTQPASSRRLQTPDASQPSRTLRHQASQDTQIYDPRPAAAEPNFDDFSDPAEQQSSYFGKNAEAKPALSVKPLPATPSSPNGATTASPKARRRAIETRMKALRSASTEPSDSDMSVEGTMSSFDSHSKVNSLTSMSTMSSREPSIPVRGGRLGDTRKPNNQMPIQGWRLPEIDEDNTFDPDIFLQGPDDLVAQAGNDNSIDSFSDRPLGTISAGRDVDFSKDDDSDGEGGAACPPDIGRYRNEDDFEMPPILQNKKSSGTTGMNLTWSGRTQKTGDSGILARFKARKRVYFG